MLDHGRGQDVRFGEAEDGVRAQPGRQGRRGRQPALVAGRGGLVDGLEVHEAREAVREHRAAGRGLHDADPESQGLGRVQIPLGHHPGADQENRARPIGRRPRAVRAPLIVCHRSCSQSVVYEGEFSRGSEAPGSARPVPPRTAAVRGRPGAVRPTPAGGRRCRPGGAGGCRRRPRRR